MCGLVGVMSSNMMMKHKECLSSMLYLDTWRGRDSTGVAALRHNADTAIMKSTIPGYEFVEGPRLGDFLRLNDFLWIGHNRYGTVGKNIKTNAHPFQILDDQGGCIVVGAHNGTLKNKHVLKDHAQFGTDSEALYNNIAEEGIEETIKKVEGAWALTYYDHVKEQFCILRNKERPLFYAFEEGKKSFFWASEMWMLRVATSRSDIKLEDDKVFSFNEDTLYTIDVPIKMNETLEMKRKGGLVGKTPTFFQGGRDFWENGEWVNSRTPPATTQGRTHEEAATGTQGRRHPPLKIPDGSQSGTQKNDSGKTPAGSSKGASNGASQQSNVTPIKSAAGMYKGYAGVNCSKAELEEQLKDGCAWCEKEEIKIGDKGYGWLAPGKPICCKCLDGVHEDQEMIDAIFAQVPEKQQLN